MTPANPLRGEASIQLGGATRVLRPSFQALVAVEDEIGPLFAIVERAAEGGLKLSEMTALFWHCIADTELPRERLGEAIAEAGLVRMTPVLKQLLGQILQGRG